MDLRDIENRRISEQFETAYINAFEGRYKSKPILGDSDVSVLRWLAKSVAPARGIELLTSYLRMDVWPFPENFHSLATFKKDVNKVIGFIGSKSRRDLGRQKIDIRVLCDYCLPVPERKFWGNYVLLCGFPNEVEEMERKCVACATEGRTEVYKPTKKERMKIFDLVDKNIAERSKRLR